MTVLDAFDGIAPGLRRRPDVEAHDLVAADASDRLILAEAEPALERAADGEVVVIGDRYGALTLPLAASGLRVRVHQDSITGRLARERNASEQGVDLSGAPQLPLGPELVRGARLVLLQLPRALDALDEIAGLVAAHAAADIAVVAGGRIKHMTLAMNDVLARHFGDVRASRAASKSRVLHAAGPLPATTSGWPRAVRHEDVGLTVVAHGAAFAGASVDIGTRFLLEFLPEIPAARRVIDLGCGTGILATAYALAHPEAEVIATDQSAAAVASARATADANGAERIRVVQDDALSGQPDGSADLVLLNPPFHSGAAVTSAIAPRLFADAARVLRPGGELWCVWNSPLGYRPALQRLVGPTRQVARNSRFTVTVSTRAAN